MPRSRPQSPRACDGCGRDTTARDGLCQRCRGEWSPPRPGWVWDDASGQWEEPDPHENTAGDYHGEHQDDV